jgi:hypothetical protein
VLINYLGRFLISPALRELCQSYATKTLAEIHDSLQNTDRISAVIRKQKLLDFPQGQDLNGVIFEIEKNESFAVSLKASLAFDKRLFLGICTRDSYRANDYGYLFYT